MVFKDDGGGFAFACSDAKFSMRASTWSTKLSQISRNDGAIHIITNKLPDVPYMSGIFNKRPKNIYILANQNAQDEARELRALYPDIQIALHSKINAKVLFVERPKTVWVSSADFGKSNLTEVAIGLHSDELYDRGIKKFFNVQWEKSFLLE
jgi:hypothetical protein